MSDPESVFAGCIPALMTPCDAGGKPDFDALAEKGAELVGGGMRGVVYCGSMGEWPLLSDGQRRKGVEALAEMNVPVVVGTGAQNSARAAALASHAREVGAAGLMIIPRVLSRATSAAAQRAHLAAVLRAGGGLPAVIYNSPYYGFETKAELFFDLAREFDNLVGFKEFGGRASLDYAAEHITSGRPDLKLVVGVDTQVVHGIVRCGASGVITGIGNVFPAAVLRLVELCEKARDGDEDALRSARDLDEALGALARFDEGPDLVLYFKRLMVLEGNPEYANALNPDDRLSGSQRGYVDTHWARFRRWWDAWHGARG
ncbi:MAG: dihydrodipicolinate synthase family protein [Gammaproteobacteria bacterium]|nr:dihydrodipicolinate synthase family protein [Gammaproteobacteria bacterium]MDE0453654.1 dihydrodipicolinate synthase family protein [Gammaproteobacteria bacterium]